MSVENRGVKVAVRESEEGEIQISTQLNSNYTYFENYPSRESAIAFKKREEVVSLVYSIIYSLGGMAGIVGAAILATDSLGKPLQPSGLLSVGAAIGFSIVSSKFNLQELEYGRILDRQLDALRRE